MPQGDPSPGAAGTEAASTRARRSGPVLAVYTGEMKGKSTAAFGMALRAWAAGLSVGVFQFVKSGKWRPGEEAALRALGEVHERTGQGAPVEWQSLGQGWSWTRKRSSEGELAAQAAEGWREIARRIVAQRHGFYLLDEFTYPMAWGWVDVDEVVHVLRSRPGQQHVVITQSGASPFTVNFGDTEPPIQEMADLDYAVAVLGIAGAVVPRTSIAADSFDVTGAADTNVLHLVVHGRLKGQVGRDGAV